MEADWLRGFPCPAASTYYKNGSAHSDEKKLGPTHAGRPDAKMGSITGRDGDREPPRQVDYEDEDDRQTWKQRERQRLQIMKTRQAVGAVRFSPCGISLCSSLSTVARVVAAHTGVD